jgi:hypothetical protein
MIAWLCAAVVGAFFAVAGALKIMGWSQWRTDAARQHLWPIAAIATPPMELLLGALLIVLRPSPVVLALSTLLLLVFTSFLAVQVLTKSSVPCACFGVRSTKPPSWKDVGRNALLLVLLFTSAALS